MAEDKPKTLRPTFHILTRRGLGHGEGHWRRSCRLQGELEARGASVTLHVTGDGVPNDGAVPPLPVFFTREASNGSSPPEATFIVLDRRETPPQWFPPLRERGSLIGIDEGSPERSLCDVLIDYLPNLCCEKPNVWAGWPGLPSPAVGPNAKPPVSLKRILVTFGGEDPAHLTEPVLGLLKDLQQGKGGAGSALGGASLEAVLGPLARRPGEETLKDVILWEAPPRLDDALAGCDLLITSWGMTLWEGAMRSLPVVLINPTPYHDELCRSAGLPHHRAGRKLTPGALKRLIRRAPEVTDRIQQFEKRRGRLSPADYLLSLDGPALFSFRQQNHGLAAPGPLYRGVSRNFYRNPAAGYWTMQPLQGIPVQYDRGYFNEEYKAQYGRTYVEDFPHLLGMAEKRLARIQSLRAGNGGGGAEINPEVPPRLIDLGCAYGPFLEAARRQGWDSRGVDISPEAVAYVKETLGLKAEVNSLDAWQPPLPAEAADLVTLWYVIEHVPDLEALGLKLNRAVKPGGLLALSTPNFSGVTGRFQRERFLEQSPRDHYHLLDPASLKRLLAHWGFKTLKVVQTGIHPRRFTGRAALVPFFLRGRAARLLGWGDTFEIYAQKIKVVPEKPEKTQRSQGMEDYV